MKLNLALAFTVFVASTSAFATVWNCPVKDPAKPPNWPDERVTAEFDNTDLKTITLVHQIPNADGTFREKEELLFSPVAGIRGGVPVAYCESDDGHVALQFGMVNMESKCATADGQHPLDFRADLHSDQDGSIYIFIFEQNGDDVVRSFGVSACRETAAAS